MVWQFVSQLSQAAQACINASILNDRIMHRGVPGTFGEILKDFSFASEAEEMLCNLAFVSISLLDQILNYRIRVKIILQPLV